MEREDHEEDERGAGGKFRKPLVRKPLSTPYSRTSSSSQTQQPQDGGGGGSGSWWWSNLVSPASRLISSGVTRFFPSFLSKPLLSDAQQPGGGGELKKDASDQGLEKFHDGIAVVTQNEGSARSPNLTGSPALSTYTATQLTPSAATDNLWENVLSSSRNMSGSTNNELTANAIDLPSDPVFSSQRNTKHSTPKNDDFVEAEHSMVIGLPKPYVQYQRRHVGTKQIKEPLFGTGVEGVDHRTENVVIRKIGQPKGQKHQSGRSKSRALGMPFQSKGPRDESLSKQMENVLKGCTQLSSYTVEENQTLSLDFPIVKDNGGTEDEASNSDLTIVQIDCTQLLGPTVEDHQTLSLCLQASNPPLSEGIEDEAANNELTIFQIDPTQLLSPTIKEHPTLSLIPEKSNPIVEDNEDTRLISNETITLRDTPVKSLKPHQSSNEVEIQFSLEATGDERASRSSVNGTTHGEGPVTPEEENCPFRKSSHIWGTIESLEVFQLMPQYPHFHPLEKEYEELREGIAMRQMLSFANLTERTRKAHFDDPRSTYESKLKELTNLEELGFVVQPLRSRLVELLKIKDRYSQLDDKLKTAEMKLIDENRQYDEIHESITRLNMELEALSRETEMEDFKVAELQKTAIGIKESLQGVRHDFDSMVAAPWMQKSPL